MNDSQTSRLALIAVMATSLLAVGVVTAISMTEEANAFIRNRITQSNTATVNQNAVSGGGTASNSATVSQSNTATQSGGSSSSSSSNTVCTNNVCQTTTNP